ncbi:MAG: cupin domain-containing protein [Candidatus Dormibacteraeota bacterium]|uniref:Cupin domain-containing protein n=1 Tax=Candidatus Dormiibacter inghamiae TaxID=3127013 RepID=A0A934KHU2_9BACT|nr:cupin domain-containing protein [Candidatus Dormibacteraeota bacterium]MBJ7605779.1 cupin domain-containing protein [Candidatus Dormibacteraeota bacterium]
MNTFHLDELELAREPDGHGYLDVLSSDRLSVGYAIWPAGVSDRQQPHAEDEVYHVVQGRATIQVAEDEMPVRAGSVIYVAAGVEHHFHSIEEELRVVVFWAPPHRRTGGV